MTILSSYNSFVCIHTNSMKQTMKVLSCILLGIALCFPHKMQALETSAESAVLYSAQTQQFIYQKNAHQKRGCASTTKILTAWVVLQNMEPTQTVTIPKEACGIEGSSLYLTEGEILTVRDLLYALMLRSANDSAVALALACAGSVEAFAEKMNEAAEQMGAHDSHFENPHGLDGENHYTTAHDLALIASKALEDPLLCEIVTSKSYTLDAPEGKRVLINHNKLLWQYEGACGIKTGYTQKCGRCLVGAAEKDGIRLISVTLNAPNDWKEHKAMFDFGFNTLECRSLAEPGQITFQAPILSKKKDTINLVNKEAVYAVLPKDADVPQMNIELNRPIAAPIKKGEVLGTAYFTLDGKMIASVSLISQEGVNK